MGSKNCTSLALPVHDHLVLLRLPNGRPFTFWTKLLTKAITMRKLWVEQLGPNGKRLKKPDYRVIPLLALASYVEKRGGLVLNSLFRSYLL